MEDEKISITPVSDETKFWIEDPKLLLKDFCFFPHRDNTFNENMNCLTTLVLIIGIVLLLFNYQTNYVLLGILLSIIIIIGVVKVNNQQHKEGFTKTRHHIDDDFIQTNVTPLVAEEWQFNPPAYELVTQVARDGQDPTEPAFGGKTVMEPPLVPYRQYLTRTNLMPNDEAQVKLFDGGATGARTFMNDAFTRHSVAFRENLTRLHKKVNNRRYRQNQYDVISPYTSF